MRIGTRPRGESDAVAELLACHERIRSFVAMARRIAAAEDAPAAEIADAATRVYRYFFEAMPRHVADEEQSLAPRLRGRSLALDHALAEMHGDHASQAALEARLIARCAELADDPARLGEIREDLGAIAWALEASYAEHLADEESTIFPALAELPDEERAAILAEMRARRS